MLIFVFFCICIANCCAISKLPSDFYQLVSKPYFVDKTELIYTFLDEREDWLRCGTQFIYYVTCPRGFGKTTNLQMIRNFAQIEVDYKGNPIAKQNTTSYGVFKNLKISKIPQFIETHLAEYAVIYVDLNFVAEDLTSETKCINALFKRIQKCYEEYSWIKPAVKNLTLQYAMHNILHGACDNNLMRRSIHDLACILYQYFEREVILLMDDFDCAARLAMEMPQLDVKILYFLIHEMLDKAHHFTCFANHGFITGVTGVNFRSMAYTHSLVEHCPFLNDHRFTPHFGFDENEVDGAIDRYNCSQNERDNLKKYYKGYKVLNLNRRIYNPLSISQYFIRKDQNTSENELLRGYWATGEKTWFIPKFARAPLFRRKIAMLLQGGTFRWVFPVKEYPPMMFYRFIKLRDDYYENTQKEDVGGFLAYFFETGFLSHGESQFIFEFPNIEIEEEFKSKFENMFNSTNVTISTTKVAHRRCPRAATQSVDSSEYSYDNFNSDEKIEDDDDGEEEAKKDEKDYEYDARVSKKKSAMAAVVVRKTTADNFTTSTLNPRNRRRYTYAGPGHREAKQVTLRTLTKLGRITSTRSRASLKALNWYEAMLTTKAAFSPTTFAFPREHDADKLFHGRLRRRPR